MNVNIRWTGSLSVGVHQSGAWGWQVNWMWGRGLIEEIVRRLNHKIIEIEYKEEGQKSSEWHLGFWWGQLGEWWDIQERRQVLLERRLSLVLIVTLRCMWSYLEGFRVCNRSGLVDRGRRWNSGSVWRREVRGECGIFPFLTCLAEKMGEVGLSVGKCEGKRYTHTHDSIYLNVFISWAERSGREERAIVDTLGELLLVTVLRRQEQVGCRVSVWDQLWVGGERSVSRDSGGRQYHTQWHEFGLRSRPEAFAFCKVGEGLWWEEGAVVYWGALAT